MSEGAFAVPIRDSLVKNLTEENGIDASSADLRKVDSEHSAIALLRSCSSDNILLFGHVAAILDKKNGTLHGSFVAIVGADGRSRIALINTAATTRCFRKCNGERPQAAARRSVEDAIAVALFANELPRIGEADKRRVR